MKKFIDMGDSLISLRNIKTIDISEIDTGCFKKNMRYKILVYYYKSDIEVMIYEDKEIRDEYYNKLKKLLCD